jgi:hypothetical protein
LSSARETDPHPCVREAFFLVGSAHLRNQEQDFQPGTCLRDWCQQEALSFVVHIQNPTVALLSRSLAAV